MMIRNVKHIVVGTAGHIDHGKSTLVKALTGVDPDRLQEEKDRGITIDLGFARYRHDGTELAFVDVPGHERFVRNMLAGASGIDGVLLVIAADESVMPQTREHFDICRLLGVTSGVIALTKADLVDDDTVQLVRLETEELVAGSFLEDAPVVPVSARSGAGLEALRAALAAMARAVTGRSDQGVPRLPIDRAFTLRGFGTVVTGTQASGRIAHDTELMLLPAGRRVKVRGLHVHGEAQPDARAGQRVAVNLAGIDVSELRRGDTLTTSGTLTATSRLDGYVTSLPSVKALKHGARVRFHLGTTEVMARVAFGAGVEPAPPDGPAYPSVLEPGCATFARLHLERPAPATRGDRFVLRRYSPPITIAGGIVLDPTPPRGRLRSAAGAARLRRLNGRDEEAVGVMVEDAGGRGVSPDELVPRLGRSRAEVVDLVARLPAGTTVATAAGRVFSAVAAAAAREALRAVVTEYHADHPLEPGLPREEARERLSTSANDELFAHVVEAAIADDELTGGRVLALPGYTVVLSEDETAVKTRLVDAFLTEGLTPPDAARWAAAAGTRPETVERMMALLVREGVLERVDTLVFHRDVLARLRADVAALKTAAPAPGPVRLDVAQFKDRFEVSRKYAIPLLEYLDGVRVTRRVGQTRIVV